MLVLEIGPGRLDAAVRQCVRECRFMPTIAEIRAKCGLDPAVLLRVAQDRAWAFALNHNKKWRFYRNGTWWYIDGTDTKVCLYWPEIPARIKYALGQGGGMEAINAANAKSDRRSLSFIRDKFDAAYERFPYSVGVTPSDLEPFAPGVSDEDMLEAVLKYEDGSLVSDNPKLIPESEYNNQKWNAGREEELKIERERHSQIIAIVAQALGDDYDKAEMDHMILGAVRSSSDRDICDRRVASFESCLAGAQRLADAIGVRRNRAQGPAWLGWRPWLAGCDRSRVDFELLGPPTFVSLREQPVTEDDLKTGKEA